MSVTKYNEEWQNKLIFERANVARQVGIVNARQGVMVMVVVVIGVMVMIVVVTGLTPDKDNFIIIIVCTRK
jgi:hypothetical protein